MLLSFSIPEMLPYLEAGLRQRAGEDVIARVKRQTIRQRGPRAEKLLEWAKDAFWTHPYDLHLWWKSRTPQRNHLGTVTGGSHVYPISILHSTVIPPNEPEYEIYRIDGPRGWRTGDSMIFWSPEHGGQSFETEAYADGFNSARDFAKYFVPNVGDTFDAILFKW